MTMQHLITSLEIYIPPQLIKINVNQNCRCFTYHIFMITIIRTLNNKTYNLIVLRAKCIAYQSEVRLNIQIGNLIKAQPSNFCYFVLVKYKNKDIFEIFTQ